MSQNDSEREVACRLTEEQEIERSEEVRSLLISHYVGYEEHGNGLHIRFEGTDKPLRAVAQFISDELQCCSFAKYDVTISPPYEETVLTVSGPDGTQQMFREGLVERMEAEST